MTVRVVAVCLGLPLLVGVIGLAVALLIADDLPDRVALHAGTGPVRAYADRGTAVAYVLLGPLAGAAAAALILAVTRRRPSGPRIAAAVGTGIAVLGTFVFLGMLWEQRGLDDPRESPGASGVAIVVAVALAVVVGGAAAAALPPRRRVHP